MKKLIITAIISIPLFFSAQTADRESVDSHQVRKGFYGNVNINSISPFDKTYNFGLGGGMHFSERFHVGLTYLGGKGETDRLSEGPSIIQTNFTSNLKYRSFGIELGYEIPLHKNFSVMPYFNQSSVRYTYTSPVVYNFSNGTDNFLNTLIGAKLFFVANENIKIGANISYGMANGAKLYHTKSTDLSGLNAGITLQYNHFFPKW